MPGLSAKRLMIRTLALHPGYVMKIIRQPIAVCLMSGWPIINYRVPEKTALDFIGVIRKLFETDF
jgi:hypothetical protein